jgi:putative cardiolipin synthase
MTSAKRPRNLFFRLAVLALTGAFASGCATLRTDLPKPASTALPPVADTPSTRYVASETSAHGNDSGFRPLISNTNALMSRVVLIDHAKHSLDLQYYIFDNDATGRLVAQRILAAADRGVRVRILLDDLDIEGHQHDSVLDALDAHPNIEIRLFNPFMFRNRSIFSKAGQFLVDGRRLNRRMHNKAFIVDGMQAIVGGRNIGDAYFDAGDEVHFRDLDVLAIGPVVPQISAMFDRYWNSDAAYPVTAYSDNDITEANLAILRDRLLRDARAFKESEYADVVAEDLPNGPSAERKGAWFWGEARLAADDPDKVDPSPGVDERRLRHIAPALRRVLDAAQSQALLISPYFIPGDGGVSLLAALVARGASVKVLTNALSATDEPEVHAGYAKYREGLLKSGVELYELKGLRDATGQRAYGASSGVSLHAKAMVIDHRQVFVGSMNFDPRSVKLNTEMGVIVDSPGLADAIEQFFAHATAPENAYRVELDDGRLRWTSKDDGKVVEFDHDPGASRWQRAKLRVLRVLPIEGLL